MEDENIIGYEIDLEYDDLDVKVIDEFGGYPIQIIDLCGHLYHMHLNIQL